MDTHKKIREHISTLSDGELSDSDLELAFAALQSPDGQQAWKTYHRIGDALRARASSELSDAFAETLVARLELEPVQLHKAGRAPSRPLYEQLLASLQRGTAPNMDQAANELLAVLQGLSSHIPDPEMVALTVLARDTLAAAKGKGQLVGAQFGGAMKLCAIHWKRLYPRIACTGLALLEQALLSRQQSALTAVALRAAAEDAGTVAWLYEASAMLGEDVSIRLAHNPVRVQGTNYHACYTGNVLRYLQCGASYNVNQYLKIMLPDPAAPALVIAGEAKGGSSGYGMVRGARSFMVSQGVASGIISQRDMLYPLSRAVYMARASTLVPAGKERKLAGKAIEQAALDGMLAYLTVRGIIDKAGQAVSSETEVFIC